MPGRVGLDRMVGRTERASRLRGVYLAIVTGNLDEGKDSRARIRVRFPWLPGDDESHWARILAPMAGASRGTYFLPEVDDQVLVVFENGDVSRPIIVGGIWSAAQKPPQKNTDGKNNIRVIKSRSGHRLIFDDTAGAERLIVVDSTRKNKVVLDSGKDSLTIESASGDIELLAPSGTVKLHGKSVKMTATGSMNGQGAQLEVTGKSMNVSATGPLELKGGRVMLNPGGGGGAAAGAGRVSAGVAKAIAAKDQVREKVASVSAALEATPGGSAPAREQASRNYLPDTRGQPPQAVVQALASTGAIQPGQPVEVSATVDGASSATYEVLDADTGEVLGSGPASVSGGRATARWDSRALAARPETSSVSMKLISGGSVAQTPAMPVAGRAQLLAAPSPSSQLIDPRAPLPLTMTAPGMGAGGALPPGMPPGVPSAAPTVDQRGRALDFGAGAGGASGSQVRAALAGDAAGAVGGGAPGMAAGGDLRGAAAARAGVDPRLAGARSAGDVGGAVTSDATARGREVSGLNEADRQRGQAEGRVAAEQSRVESQLDPEVRARGEASVAEARARAEVAGPTADAERVQRQAAAGPPGPDDARARVQAEADPRGAAASEVKARVVKPDEKS